MRKVVWRAKHNPPRTVQSGRELIAGEPTNQLDGQRGWKRRVKMRVASLENVLTVATLVLGIVVMLWEIKIFCGM